MDEIKRLTPAQRARCNRLIRRLCANYDGGNCLPLDDGEGCVCVQMISYSLLCKYFRRAVLPTDKALYADIYRQRTRLCDRCGKPFARSEEHTSELQSPMWIAYAVFCLRRMERPHSRQYFCRLLPGAKGFPHRSQSRVRCR